MLNLHTVADSDYDPSILATTFTINQDTPPEGVCFTVPITPDSKVEGNETFTLVLDHALDVVTHTNQSLIQIVNDDGKCLPMYTLFFLNTT